MKKTVLFVALALLCAAPTFAQGPFNDVPTDHWAYDAVNQLQKDGIVIGYPDGTYGGKRAMSRYEFAVAIARLLPMMGQGDFVTNAQLQQALADYVKKSELPTTDLSTLATKADVEAIRKLVDEFKDELAALGVDVDALKRDVCALAARVDALEAEVRRVRFTGDVNVFAIANDHRGNVATAFDLDNRAIQDTATLGRTIGVVRDFDLNVVGRVSENTTANATINYGNYLNYLVAVDDYVGGVRQTNRNDVATVGDLAENFVDNFFPYYLYIDSAMGFGDLTVGRMPMQFTPYTLKKIDVDSYTSILKTDSGNYPVDGAKLGLGFGGVDVTLFAVKHDENQYLVNGLTGQPRAGFGSLHTLGGNTVGGLTTLATQTAGTRIAFGTPWKGNVGLTYYQTWSENAFNAINAYDQARVFGADLAIPLGSTFALAGSWTQSDTLGTERPGLAKAANIDSDNTAWDAKVTAAFGKLGFGAGYKNIERNFAAAGSWDKIGRWTNPVNVQGPYVDINYPITRKVKFVANGELLNMIDNVNGALNTNLGRATSFGLEDDEILKAEAGLQWGLSNANSLGLGIQWVKYSPDNSAVDDAIEQYITVGWAHQVNSNAGFKVGYQFINWNGGANAIIYGPDYRAGEAVAQFGVTF